MGSGLTDRFRVSLGLQPSEGDCMIQNILKALELSPDFLTSAPEKEYLDQ